MVQARSFNIVWSDGQDFKGFRLIESASQKQSPKHFYLSSLWFNHYLPAWDEAELHGIIETKGSEFHECAGWLSKASKKSKLRLNYTSLALNESQSEKLKSVTLETNGFFGVGQELETNAFESIFEQLSKRQEWSELRIAAVDNKQTAIIEQLARTYGLICFKINNQLTYSTDLEKVRLSFQGNFLNSLSSNARSQLRRAQRKCESALGKIERSYPKSLEETFEWLDQLASLHNSRWSPNDSVTRGFTDQRFNDFWRELTRKLWDHGALRLMRLKAGEKVLAYLYNIEFEGTLFFAIGGVNYENTAEFRPGILAHYFAIDEAIQVGMLRYDFMVGTNRYKETLSNHQDTLSTLCLRRRRLDFIAEDYLRTIKRKFFQ
jgi:hypothetical protein